MKHSLSILFFLPLLLHAQQSTLDLYFASGIDSLDEAELSRLEAWCASALAQNQVPLTLTGYADSVGKPAYNLALSQRRVEHIAQHLLPHFPLLSGDSLSMFFRGEVSASAQNMTEAARQHNRRVTITSVKRKIPLVPIVIKRGCNELVIWPGDFEGDINDIAFEVNFVNNEQEMQGTALGGNDISGWPLTSGGMVELTALRNGKPVKQLRPLQVTLAVAPGTPAMDLWSGVPQGQVVSWSMTGAQCRPPSSGSYFTTLSPAQCPDRLVAAIGEGGSRRNCDKRKPCLSCRFGFWTINFTAKQKFAKETDRGGKCMRIGQFNETDSLPLWSGTCRQVFGLDTLIAAQVLNWRTNTSKDWVGVSALYKLNGDAAKAPGDSLSWIQNSTEGKHCDLQLMLRGNASSTGLAAWTAPVIPADPCELETALIFKSPVADWAITGTPFSQTGNLKKVKMPRKWKLEASFYTVGKSEGYYSVKDAVLPLKLSKGKFIFVVVHRGKTYFVRGQRKNILSNKKGYKIKRSFLRRHKGKPVDISAMMPG